MSLQRHLSKYFGILQKAAFCAQKMHKCANNLKSLSLCISFMQAIQTDLHKILFRISYHLLWIFIQLYSPRNNYFRGNCKAKHLVIIHITTYQFCICHILVLHIFLYCFQKNSRYITAGNANMFCLHKWFALLINHSVQQQFEAIFRCE